MSSQRRRPSKCWSTTCIVLLLFAYACSTPGPETWPDSVHEQGRAIFYQTLRERIASHPDRDQLTSAEIDKIGHAETEYPRLYELLINIYYQKDAPDFGALLQQSTDESEERFRQLYLDLARFAARRFIDNFFATPVQTEYSRRSNPAYASLDAVDLAVRTTGYFAKLDPPEQRRELRELSPEFDTQWSLDAARFRQAHEITRGAGARIAILDTGIDETHPVFRDTRWGKHFSLIGRIGKPWTAEASVVDWGWHGTAISSVVARYAPEAQITMYKIGDGDTQNDPAYQVLMQSIVAASIYKAVHDGNDVISISLSGASLDDPYLREAVRYAHENNRVVLSGSLYHHWLRMGNNLNFPGQYETVISVTAIERRPDGTFGYWDVCAPDDTTTVAAPNGAFLAYPMHALDEEDSYAPSISAAIPVVAALAGLTVAEHPRSGTEEPGEYADTITRLITDNANSEIVGFEGFSPQCGHGLIDAEKTVKAAVRLHAQRTDQGGARGEGRTLDSVLGSTRRDAIAGIEEPAPRSREVGGELRDMFEQSALALAGFDVAHEITEAAGVKVAIVSTGIDLEHPVFADADIDIDHSFSLVGRQRPPGETEDGLLSDFDGRGTAMASIVHVFAPRAELRIYRIEYDPDSLYQDRLAMQLAQAIRRAAADGADVIAVDSGFADDYPFLRAATQFAYEHDAIVVAPTPSSAGGEAGPGKIYPARYNSTIAVTGVLESAPGHAVPWDAALPRHSTDVAAPATLLVAAPRRAAGESVHEVTSDYNAVAVAASAVALIRSRVEKVTEHLPGEQFQRIYEILTSTCDPTKVGFASFAPPIGYGLIDAAAAVGDGLREPRPSAGKSGHSQ